MRLAVSVGGQTWIDLMHPRIFQSDSVDMFSVANDIQQITTGPFNLTTDKNRETHGFCRGTNMDWLDASQARSVWLSWYVFGGLIQFTLVNPCLKIDRDRVTVPVCHFKHGLTWCIPCSFSLTQSICFFEFVIASVSPLSMFYVYRMLGESQIDSSQGFN